MKKIFVLGILVGAVSVYGARAELVETVTTTENEIISIETPIVVESATTSQETFGVSNPVVSDVEEAVIEDVFTEEAPEPEPVDEYPVPTEDIPD